MFESLIQLGERKVWKPAGLTLLVGAVFALAIWVLASYLA